MADATPPTGLDAPAIRSARALLDHAKDAADAANTDRLFRLPIPAWGTTVTLRRLPYGAVMRALSDGGADLEKRLRLLLVASLVDPVFTAGEVDELLTDPDQADAAMDLNMAVGQINNLSRLAQEAQIAAFRPADPVV